MNITVFPGRLTGEINAIHSKSELHRLLIASALAGGSFSMGKASDDIRATSECLDVLFSRPSESDHKALYLNCRESASTLRLLMPVVAAVKTGHSENSVIFRMKKSLFHRPVTLLTDELSKHGCFFEFNEQAFEISVSGKLVPGDFQLPGNVSSQFVSGLLFALPLLENDSLLCLTSPLQSKGYVEMTLDTLKKFNIDIETDKKMSFFKIKGSQNYEMPAVVPVPGGDWSSAAPFLCANSMGSRIKITGLSENSLQGDRAILSMLNAFDNPHDRIMDISDVPDLLPCLAVRACFAKGKTRFTKGARLRLKESDRLKTTSEMLQALGGDVEIAGDELIVTGHGHLSGGSVSSAGDHRIAMAATLAGTFADGPVTISDAECVSKSYPEFFNDYRKLNGKTEMNRTYSFGKNLKVEICGGSHEPEMTATLYGLPANTGADTEALAAFMKRRAPGRKLTSARCEEDVPQLEKLRENGTAYKITIANKDMSSGDYKNMADIPRPGHADYTSFIKYGKILPGGGPFSGRMTAPICAAGGIALQVLEKKGITIGSHIFSIGEIYDTPFDPSDIDKTVLKTLQTQEFPVNDSSAGQEMKKAVEKAIEEKDSLGGIIEIAVAGLPAGIGGPLFEGLESRLSEVLFAIPGVKGVEFGTGFAASILKGSENNDAFMTENCEIRTITNHHGGILGGISTGMPLIARVAFKPTPSIGKVQQSVNLNTLKPEVLEIKGRHDPCIVMRAAPVCEAAAALALLDMIQGEAEAEEISLTDIRKEIDSIDDKLLELFEKRMALGLKAFHQKEKSGAPVQDKRREEEILNKVAETLESPLESYGRELFEKLMKLSRDYQNSSRKDK